MTWKPSHEPVRYDRARVAQLQPLQEARLAIKADGDPTWLAYTVFANPFATVKLPE